MTPEERRKRVEYVANMAEQGILVEPAYDREEWRRQQAADELAEQPAPKVRRRAPLPRKAASRRTA
jgi:hypothetical protein